MLFLSLPPALRQRIYHQAGLAHNYDINLNRVEDPVHFLPSPNLATFLTLLQTCRRIYTEVISLFYSTNTFFIRFRDSQNLNALSHLGADAVASLVNLTVHLNVSSCELNRTCCAARLAEPGRPRISWKQPSCETHPTWNERHRHDSPLRMTSHLYQDILTEWQHVARFLAIRVQPFKLSLHIVCDTADLETAKWVTEPLQGFPILADCEIRLGWYRDCSLQTLAQDTATTAMGYDTTRSDASFRFQDLAPEIRRQILEFTDLITPLGEVEWTPEKGFSVPCKSWSCSYYEGCPPCTEEVCWIPTCWEHSKHGCFCRRFHSAFSSACQCWLPPWPLFLTCRAMRDEAMAVFFLRNRFIVLPYGGCGEVVKNAPPRLEPSIFLTEIVPPEALSFLRFVEIVFPPFEDCYLLHEEPAYRDWISAIQKAKDRLNLPLLTLRIYLVDLPTAESMSFDMTFRTTITPLQAHAIYQTYFRIVNPLSAWSGLGRFFAHIAWPFAWTRRGQQYQEKEYNFPNRHVAPIERRMERKVMGVCYDAHVAGKGQQKDSLWFHYNYKVDLLTWPC